MATRHMFGGSLRGSPNVGAPLKGGDRTVRRRVEITGVCIYARSAPDLHGINIAWVRGQKGANFRTLQKNFFELEHLF